MCKEINKNKYSQIFILFLKENDCYKQFIENCHEIIKKAIIQQLITNEDEYSDDYYNNVCFYQIWQKHKTITNYLLTQEPGLFLQGPFCWASTTQGDVYWSKLHRKWLNYLDKYKKK